MKSTTCAVHIDARSFLYFDFVLSRRLAQNLGKRAPGSNKNRFDFNWKVGIGRAGAKAGGAKGWAP
jgi:hypothetical protein